MSLVIIHTDCLNCSSYLSVYVLRDALVTALAAAILNDEEQREIKRKHSVDYDDSKFQREKRELETLGALLTIACDHERIMLNQPA